MRFRKILFWMHLTAGILAGTIILLMSVTGVLLAYQRQITTFADTRKLPAIAPQEVSNPLNVEKLLQQVSLQAGAKPTAVTFYSQANQPLQVELGRERVVFLNPYSGMILGEGSSGVRQFFRRITDWHRWLGMRTEARSAGRLVTGVCNLIFLGIVLSGLCLWLPRKWSWQNVRAVVFYRSGLPGKAREFNWHNVTGIWCAIPLLMIVVSGVVMSFPWANALLYRMTGTEPPANVRQQSSQPASSKGRLPGTNDASGFAGLNVALLRAKTQDPAWRIITMRLASDENPATVAFTIITGIPGRPDQRAQLVVARDSGEVVRWEPFSSYNSGRRLRSWLRFIHTGEAGGIVGQTIAALASTGAAFLMCTGTILAVRRLSASRARRRSQEFFGANAAD